MMMITMATTEYNNDGIFCNEGPRSDTKCIVPRIMPTIQTRNYNVQWPSSLPAEDNTNSYDSIAPSSLPNLDNNSSFCAVPEYSNTAEDEEAELEEMDVLAVRPIESTRDVE